MTKIIENHPNDSRVKFTNTFQTLSSRMGTGGGNTPMVMEEQKVIVRRLTPLECERLQGFPDNWTKIGEWTDSKGKKHKESDSPRYKALGNSIALPFGNGSQREWSASCEPKETKSRQWQASLMASEVFLSSIKDTDASRSGQAR